MFDLLSKGDAIDYLVGRDDMLTLAVFALSRIFYRLDRTAYRETGGTRNIRKGRFVSLDEVREWGGIWMAEEVD